MTETGHASPHGYGAHPPSWCEAYPGPPRASQPPFWGPHTNEE